MGGPGAPPPAGGRAPVHSSISVSTRTAPARRRARTKPQLSADKSRPQETPCSPQIRSQPRTRRSASPMISTIRARTYAAVAVMADRDTPRAAFAGPRHYRGQGDPCTPTSALDRLGLRVDPRPRDRPPPSAAGVPQAKAPVRVPPPVLWTDGRLRPMAAGRSWLKV